MSKKTRSGAYQATHASDPSRAEPEFREDRAFSEKHYSVSDVAKQWGISENCVRDIFRDEPGVFKT